MRSISFLKVCQIILITLIGSMISLADAKSNPVFNNPVVKITMHLVAPGVKAHNIGYIEATDSRYGLLLIPHLNDIPPGFHGFHVHVKPSCARHGLAAGGHLDPYHTDKHLGPYDRGHLGDLPILYANKRQQILGPVIAPHLTLADIRQHTLMIHQGGDNYADHPEKLGGGGARYACGVVK